MPVIPVVSLLRRVLVVWKSETTPNAPNVVTRSEGAFMSVGPRALHNLPRLLQTSTPRRRREVDCPPWYSRFSRRNAHRDAFCSDRCRFRRQTLLFCLDISNIVGKGRMNRFLSCCHLWQENDEKIWYLACADFKGQDAAGRK